MENKMILGLDVGGTHTDVVLIDRRGLVDSIKVPTDETNLFETVLTGIEAITRSVAPEKINRAVLSTTLTTNAIVQKKTAPTGMIVSSGPGINPESYRTGDHFYTVAGSIDHRGREISPVIEDEITEIAQRMHREGIRNVGWSGSSLFATPPTKSPSEKFSRTALTVFLWGTAYRAASISPAVSPPPISTPLSIPCTVPSSRRWSGPMEKKGWQIPIHILKADGGTMSFSSSIDFPAQSILSGPAASVMGASAFAREDQDCLVLDIGGTTTDMGILVDGAPVLEPLGIRVAERRTLIRSLMTQSHRHRRRQPGAGRRWPADYRA
jgi:N-methylhydantoinase A